jgi:hypothetical protein
LNDARSRSPIALTIARLWRASMSTTFRIAGSPMNPEGRWFRNRNEWRTVAFGYRAQRLLLKTVFFESGSEDLWLSATRAVR